MSETKTEVVDTKSIGASVVEKSPLAVGGASSAMAAAGDDVSDSELSLLLGDMGFIVPAASPEMIRRAFALKQKMFAAILDESDYLYTVSYQNTRGGRAFTDQVLTTDHAHALERAEMLNGKIRALPKKSGIVKLARALGIEARPIESSGLPADPLAQFSYVMYEAKHTRTGAVEFGKGFCDSSERNGKISKHHIIATADTRAYNRAVMRLSGFGEVSADEVIATTDGNDIPERVPSPSASMHPAADLPPTSDESVMSAARAWAEAIVGREMVYRPAAQQEDKSARNLRAQARRGDIQAATTMGALGLAWIGRAQDDNGTESFHVDSVLVQPEDIAAQHAAVQAASVREKADAALSNLGKGTTTGGSALDGKRDVKPDGWDLSNKGSKADDDPALEFPPSTDGPAPTSPVDEAPAPDMTMDTITGGQARILSKMLLALFGRAGAGDWLKTVCQVGRSVDLRMNQYEPVKALLQTKIKDKEEG